MFNQRFNTTFVFCTAFLIAALECTSAQNPNISVIPEDGFILELDVNNPQATAQFKIYNIGGNSVSLNLSIESADSSYILYVDEPDTLTFNGNIWKMRPDGSEKTQLTYDTLDREPVWSADGAKIVFYSFRSGNADVWVMNSDGTNLINLTDNPAGDYNPHWSHDGQYIIFSTDRDFPYQEIYRMTAAGEDVQRLTFNDPQDHRPQYSPDGEYFVTGSRFTGQEYDIYVYTSDGQSFVNIGVPDVRNEYQPSWTPDSKRIVWCSGDQQLGELNLVSANRDGSDFRLEYSTPENDYIPRFYPEGQFLAFSKSTFYPTGGDEIFVWHKMLDELIQITDSTSVTREWGPEWSPFLNSPSWLSVDQNTFQIGVGNNISITNTIDVSGYPIGTYTASVMIYNSANNNLLAVVPLNVILSSSVGVEDPLKPAGVYTLSQNYPNPFNPETIISFRLPNRTRVELRIYDLLGRETKTLFDGYQDSGYKSAIWDGKDNTGRKVSSGIYMYRLQTPEFSETKKLILLR